VVLFNIQKHKRKGKGSDLTLKKRGGGKRPKNVYAKKGREGNSIFIPTMIEEKKGKFIQLSPRWRRNKDNFGTPVKRGAAPFLLRRGEGKVELKNLTPREEKGDSILSQIFERGGIGTRFYS